MKNLSYSHVYLAGPMDRVKDNGVVWRRNIAPFLQSLSIAILDPTDKKIDRGNESVEFQAFKHQLKREERWEELTSLMKEVVSIDLRMVDKADFIILHVDTDVHMCGSYGEQSHACLQRKPVIIHCEQGKKGVPDWLFGICDHKYFFSNWSDVKRCIIDIHENGTNDKKWKLFKYILINNEHKY